jgi:predicted dehydrogenase
MTGNVSRSDGGPTRLIQVGTGGFGEWWCTQFLPPFVEAGAIEVVAAVDVDRSAHQNAIDGLGLADEDCFVDLDEALRSRPADALTIVVPPAFHESVVDAAIENGMDVLCEKPITDTLEGSIRVVEKVRRAGIKMAVTMGHRFDWDKSTLRSEIEGGRNGGIDYMVARFTANARRYGTWRPFRHEMDHPMLLEGSVHHLDILANLAGAPAKTIWAKTWKPPWAEYKGDTNVFLVMEFENGVKAQYEAATANAVGINSWRNEYIRVECELATLIMDRRAVRRYPIDLSQSMVHNVDMAAGEVVALPEDGPWTHFRLIQDFLDWRDGGPAMETEVSQNLRSVAYVQAAIDSSRGGEQVEVARYIPDGLPG